MGKIQNEKAHKIYEKYQPLFHSKIDKKKSFIP